MQSKNQQEEFFPLTPENSKNDNLNTGTLPWTEIVEKQYRIRYS
jgi:hypothetical protein